MIQDFRDYLPLSHYCREEAKFINHGKLLLQQGKVGSIALAGGHGSRLGFEAPKGCYPISRVFKKSLYQLLAERTLAASNRAGCDLQLAIMTSDATHDLTVAHFEEANYFGLKKEQVAFFMQENLPLLDDAGQEMDVQAPNGNGALFWYFSKSGLLDSWLKLGIEQMIVYNIDNALVDPFQPSLVGLNDLHKNEATVVGVERQSFDEKVGLLVEREKKLAVVEYSEMDEDERHAPGINAPFKHTFANISYFAFSLDFVQRVIAHPYSQLPLHRAKKTIRVGPQELTVTKREYFIFDVLSFAKKAEVLFLDRRDYFAPLKNHSGAQSVETVQKQLEDHDRRKFYKLTHKWPPEDQPFELSPLYGII